MRYAKVKHGTTVAVSAARYGLSRFPCSKQITVVETIAVHASVTARENQQQRDALERAAPPAAVYIEAATPGTLAIARPGFPHTRHVF